MRSVLSAECMSYLYYAGDFLLSLVLQSVDKALEGDLLCTFLVLPVRGRWRGGRGICRWRRRRRGGGFRWGNSLGG